MSIETPQTIAGIKDENGGGPEIVVVNGT